MANDTILGGPPSGTNPSPDRGGRHGDGPATRPPGLEAVADADDVGAAFHRGRAYSLLGLGFARPDATVEAALADGAIPDDLRASAAAVDRAVGRVAAALEAHLDDADDLGDEWVGLFGLEAGVPVSPYELTYLPGPLVTNVRKLADLNGFYRAFGLEIAPEGRDRGDHLCYLLEFLGRLSMREAALRKERDAAGVAVCVDARRQFLEDHLGRWYWRFADEVGRHGDGFYPALADVLAALVETEVDRLDLEPDWVPDDPGVTEWTSDVFGDAGRDCGGCGVGPGSPAAGPPGGDRRPTQDGDPTA